MRREVIGDCELWLGDCREVMAQMEAGCVDAICCDPPYNLDQIGRSLQLSQNGDGTDRTGQRNYQERGFMGCTWDNAVAFRPETWEVVLAALKTSGYLLAFGGTRTFHRLACALEDAGFEMRDTISHLFDSDSRMESFLASLNDEQRGAFDELVAPAGPLMWCHGQGFPKGKSCLKPAWEPVLLCRRPGRGVLPLGIEECRIGVETTKTNGWKCGGEQIYGNGQGIAQEGYQGDSRTGRWPANLVLSHHEDCRCVGVKRVRGITGGTGNHDGNVYGKRTNQGQPVKDYTDADGMEVVEEWVCVEGCPVKAFGVYGESKSSDRVRNNSGGFGSNFMDDNWHPPEGITTNGHSDAGTPARFFYTAKASRSERWFYCRDCLSAYPPDQRDQHRHDHRKPDGSEDWSHLTAHPTQKSLALMEWLVRLISKPGDVVLDPFAGSFSTAIACIRSGRRFIGIEQDPEYFTIGLSRIRAEYERSPLYATSGTE